MNIISNRFNRWQDCGCRQQRSSDYELHQPCGDSAELGSRLCLAVLRGDNREVEWLLKSGAPTDYQDQPDGWTPLIYSIYYNNPSGRKILLMHGADPLGTDFAGRTTLMFAAINGDLELLGSLIARGVPPEAEDYHGKTALDFAVEYQRSECAAFLKILKNYTAALPGE